MRRALATALVAAVAAVPAAAGTRASQDAALAKRGLSRSVQIGALAPEDADAYRAEVDRAARVLTKLGGARYANLAGALHDVAALWRSYSEARALTLFSMLAANTTWFGNRAAPTGRKDITDEDGIVYRFFPGHGFQFHPLANAGALNSAVAAKDADRAGALATALLARATTGPGGALRWEYEFPYGGGRPPWTSGMAQAVMAQAFARTETLTEDPADLQTARAAFRAIPGALVRQLPAGPWIRLYSFDGTPVLNAQLQSAISVGDYATATGDADAAALASALQAAAEALLPRFDTGYWSLYSLGGPESPLDYHTYVVSLLKKLAQRNPDDPVWADTATRFQAYETQPPVLRASSAPQTVFPRPADGYLDAAPFGLWVSKISRVTISGGGRSTTLTLGRGDHRLAWAAGASLQPGTYVPHVTAVDLAGNTASVDLAAVAVAWDTKPPAVEASVAGRRLSWKVHDPGTPWVAFRVALARGTKHVQLWLGRRSLAGKLALPVPHGTWRAVLLVTNSAGKTARVDLGTVPAA